MKAIIGRNYNGKHEEWVDIVEKKHTVQKKEAFFSDK